MKKIILALSFVVLGAFAIKAQDNQPKAQDNPNAPEIKFEKTSFDYGTIKKATAADDPNGNGEFKFTNTGKEPLVIQSATASCGCTIPSFSKEPIMPGKSGVIKVHYATTRVGTINKTITVKSNAKTSTVYLTIVGNVLDTPADAAPVKQDSGPVNH